jgi:hypothetical protein
MVIRQNRLVAGVYTLSELDYKLRQLCLLMPKTPMQCTAEDAKVLVEYKGLQPSANNYNEYIDDAVRAPK